MTLGNKLTVLVLATVVVTLALMGGAFWWILQDFHKVQARDEIQDATRALRFELDRTNDALQGTVHRLALHDDVIAAVNLVHAYENPGDYEPGVFDAEKRKLARHFNQVAMSASFDLVAAYTISGRLTAFSLAKGMLKRPGFITYDDQGMARFVIASENEPDSTLLAFTPPAFMLFEGAGPAERAGRLILSRVPGALLMEFTAPIVRMSPSGVTHNIGWVRAARLLDADYFKQLGNRLGVSIAVKGLGGQPDGEPIAGPPDVSAPFDGPVPVLSFYNEDPPTFAWRQVEDGYLGAVSLPLSSGENVPVILRLATAELVAGLAAFGNAAGVVLLLAAFALFPAMVVFMRANVTRPLNALVDSASRLASGDWIRPAGTHRADEIGALARAFDEMASTVQSRERLLREKQSLLDGMVSNAPSLIQVKDVAGHYLMVNNRWEEFFAKSKGDVIGTQAEDVLDPQTARLVRANDDKVRRTRVPHQFEERLTGAVATRTFYSIKFPLFDDRGDVYAICGISQDITERKTAEERLRLTQRVVDETAEGIMITDGDTRIVEVNPAFSMITGYARDEVIGRKPSMMSSGRHDPLFYKEMWNELKRTGQWSGEIWDRRKSGEVYPKWLSISSIFGEDGKPTHYVGVFSDITKVKETERQLEQLAHYDALTGLPNRLLFQDRLRRALARHRRHEQTGALMFLDLDRFKQVNDTLGHEKGDELLVEATRRLLDCVREDDTVARLGGDEFTVILSDLQDETLARDVAQRIIHNLEKPFDLDGHETFISASIGIVLFPGDGDTIEALIRNADMAMYEAKNQGRATYRFFNASMNARALERMNLEMGLRAATFDEQLRVFYQPKFEIRTRRIVSVEALVRWQHPERGLLGPDKFIALAEETGLILDIGRWVLFEACRQARRWLDEGIHLPVAVNLSARQFSEPNLVDDIARALQETGLTPDMLVMEITESMLMDDVERAVSTLNRFKRLGVAVAIDDFGTGYSSLNQLRRLPVDELKIDQTFVGDIPDSIEDMEIVTAVISMAKSLKLKVVAEGVETFDQLEFLQAQGCDLAQGFLIGKPVEGTILPMYLDEGGPNADLLAPTDPTKRPPRTLQ